MRSMRYTDHRGVRRTMTPEQANYLDVASRGFDRGWGGLSSTRTVRILHYRGLIVLDEFLYRNRGWRVTGRTHLGDQVIEQWLERAAAE